MPLGPSDLCGEAGSQGVIRLEQIKIWPVWKETLTQEGCHLLAVQEDGPCPEAVERGFSLCVSGTPRGGLEFL